MIYGEEQAALDEAVRQWPAQLDSPEDTPAQVRHKQAAYRKRCAISSSTGPWSFRTCSRAVALR